MAKRTIPATVTIIGPGSLGSVLAGAFHSAGYRIEELVVRSASRSKRASQKLATRLGARLAVLPAARLTADVIWICVPDDAIATVAAVIGRRLSRRQTLLHSSGVLTSDILRHGDYVVASAHPMMSFTRALPAPLKGVGFALEGDRRAVSIARKLIAVCGGDSFAIAPRQKVLYHAFGSFCSPLLLATLVAAESVGKAAGIKQSKLRTLSAPIMRKTLENYLAEGGGKALSGPLRRGDTATIERHLQALQAMPEIKRIYVALSRFAVERLPGKDKAKLLKLLATS